MNENPVDPQTRVSSGAAGGAAASGAASLSAASLSASRSSDTDARLLELVESSSSEADSDEEGSSTRPPREVLTAEQERPATREGDAAMHDSKGTDHRQEEEDEEEEEEEGREDSAVDPQPYETREGYPAPSRELQAQILNSTLYSNSKP